MIFHHVQWMKIFYIRMFLFFHGNDENMTVCQISCRYTYLYTDKYCIYLIRLLSLHSI